MVCQLLLTVAICNTILFFIKHSGHTYTIYITIFMLHPTITGIITNFKEIKKFLQANLMDEYEAMFESETDTEAIAKVTQRFIVILFICRRFDTIAFNLFVKTQKSFALI